MLNLTRPRYVMPVHGDYKRLRLHSQLAQAVGVPAREHLPGRERPAARDHRVGRGLGQARDRRHDLRRRRRHRRRRRRRPARPPHALGGRHLHHRRDRLRAGRLLRRPARGPRPRRAVPRRQQDASSTTCARRSRTRSTAPPPSGSPRSTCSSRCSTTTSRPSSTTSSSGARWCCRSSSRSSRRRPRRGTRRGRRPAPASGRAVLPLQLGHARRPEPLTRREHRVTVAQPEPEVVGVGAGPRPTGTPFESASSDPCGVTEDEQVLVVMDALGQPEMLGVERGGALAVGDGEGDVVEGHQACGRAAAASESRVGSGTTSPRARHAVGAAGRRPTSTKRRDHEASRTSTSTPMPATAYAVRGDCDRRDDARRSGSRRPASRRSTTRAARRRGPAGHRRRLLQRGDHRDPLDPVAGAAEHGEQAGDGERVARPPCRSRRGRSPRWSRGSGSTGAARLDDE